MANILLVDPGEIPRSAMQGILDRGEHRLACVETETEAWDFITAQLKVDLIFVELQLKDGSGLRLVQRLRADSQLKFIPLVIYTARGDRNAVRVCLQERVQNFLIKPYDEDVIFKEIAKAEANPWRQRLFEEESSFCRMMGYEPSYLHKMLGNVRKKAESAVIDLKRWAAKQEDLNLPKDIVQLKEDAEEAGAWGIVEVLSQIESCGDNEQWTLIPGKLDTLGWAARLIDHRLDPDISCVGFMNQQEMGAREDEEKRNFWLDAPEQDRCPVLKWDDLKQQIENLKGCPVIDSAVAAYQMTATGQPSCINPLMDVVARDAGLSTEVLLAANRLHPPEEGESGYEDARSAVGMLGEMKLANLGRNLIKVSQRTFDVPPNFNWTQFWIFQRGVSRIATMICEQLELYSLEPIARGAGQLHDIGKMVLAHLEPIGFQVAIEHCRRHGLPLSEAEKLYFDASSFEIGAHFAEHFGLSKQFSDVIRWVESPNSATDNRRLVAVVSLARDFCDHNGVGASGNPMSKRNAPFWADRSRAWEVLQDCVFPSFNVREFERLITASCRALRIELAGQDHRADADQVAVTR